MLLMFCMKIRKCNFQKILDDVLMLKIVLDRHVADYLR